MTDNQQSAHQSQHVPKAKPKILRAISEKLERFKRTIEVARKPDKEEFIYSAKTSAFGIFLIGAIGFILFIIYNLLLRGLGA